MLRPVVRRSLIQLSVLLMLAGSIGCQVGCQHAPPTLGPTAQTAWQATRVIKALDTLRDIAVAANATNPPMMTEDDTRKVVIYHRSAITTVHAAPNGWPTTVLTGLNEVINSLPPATQQLLGPYVTLAQSVIKEVMP